MSNPGPIQAPPECVCPAARLQPARRSKAERSAENPFPKLSRNIFPGHFGCLAARLQHSRRLAASEWPGNLLPKLYRERFSIVLDVRPLACSRPGGQGRQMARTPFPTVVEGRISWPCQVSGSSPAASQEVQAARWPESVPQNYKCKDSLVILGVQQLSCSLPGDSKPPNGREIFFPGSSEKDFRVIWNGRQLTCSLPSGPMSPKDNEILFQIVRRRVS